MGTELTLPQLLKTEKVIGRFKEILGAQATSFVSSLLTMYKDSEKLRKCDPVSILAAAGQVASLKLPLQLGYAYVIPYYDYKSGKYMAQYQLGYKGKIQLAMRSGQIRKLNSNTIYEGEIRRINPITGDIEIGERTSDNIVGYVAYMELINGFSKTLYMSKAEVERYAMTFSESYRNEKTRERSVWAKNFDAMAEKTVLKKLVDKYAPTSTEMQDVSFANALRSESPVTVDSSDDSKLDENTEFDTIDVETGEVLNDDNQKE